MAGRPGLELGEWGKVKLTPDPLEHPKAGRYVARAYQRDHRTGRRAAVTASGTTADAATKALTAKMRAHNKTSSTSGSGRLSGSSTVAQLATAYLEDLDASSKAILTKTRYRRTVEHKVVPMLGGLRLRELSSGKLTVQIMAVWRTSPSEARMMRDVCGGLMRFALTHD